MSTEKASPQLDKDLDPPVSTPKAKLDWPANVPTEKLIALMNASNEMMQSSFRRDRQATLKIVARYGYEILNIEACGVFLVPKNASRELLQVSSFTDVRGDNFEPKRLQIRDTPKGGMTGYFAHKGEIIRLQGHDNIVNHRNNAGNTDHLASTGTYSVMGIPLKDRKKRLLGIIVATNKKNEEGEPTEKVFFDEVDESIARILASQVVIVLENLRLFETLRDLLHTTQSAQSLKQVLDTILIEGLTLLNAHRGEIALWDEARQELIITAQSGESKTVVPGQPVPIPGIMYTLWQKDEPGIFVPDVTTFPNYHEASPQTRCEIAVRLATTERKIGILNVESFQLGGLDEQDIEVLELVAQYAVIAVQIIGKEVRFRDIVTQFGDSRPSRDVLTGILESVRDIYGLTSSMIYIADDTKDMLRIVAFVNEEEIEIYPVHFGYGYKDESLAIKVFHEKEGYFSEDPPNDPVVNPIGLETFHISGSIVGVPLIFNDQVVGVLVGWSSHNSQLPKREYIDELKPIARLAAANIAISESEQNQTNILQTLQHILLQMQREQSLEAIIRSILRGVQAAGFDRVRIWKFREDIQRFFGLESVGMGPLEAQFRGFKGQPVTANSTLYDMIQNKTIPPKARVFFPDSARSHPYTEIFNIPPDLPWAAVALRISGRLYGFIAGENTITRREITTNSLEYMSMLGALAALEIANAEIIDTLRASKLKDEFLQRMAHIFGTSTSGVQALTGNLRKGIIDNERALKEYIPAITKLNERFLGIAQSLIDFAALKEDTKLNIVSVDLVDLIEDAINLLHSAIQEKQIYLEKNFPETEHYWRLDTVRVTNAIEALLDNAIKFSPPNSTIHVSLLIDDKQAFIAIRDQGPGISEKDRPLLFDSFYRGQNAQVAHKDGAGLGLAIVGQTMKLHGGETDVRNHPDGGAEFILRFPNLYMEEKESSKDA